MVSVVSIDRGHRNGHIGYSHWSLRVFIDEIMTALPEWIEGAWTNGHERVAHHDKLKEALAIAWEALEKIKVMGSNGSQTAHDTMRRIAALGEGK